MQKTLKRITKQHGTIPTNLNKLQRESVVNSHKDVTTQILPTKRGHCFDNPERHDFNMKSLD